MIELGRGYGVREKNKKNEREREIVGEKDIDR